MNIQDLVQALRMPSADQMPGEMQVPEQFKGSVDEQVKTFENMGRPKRKHPHNPAPRMPGPTMTPDTPGFLPTPRTPTDTTI